MKYIHATFKDLSNRQLMDALRLRQQVFIIEQNCFYEDIDGGDPNAEHLLMYKGDILAGYLRIFQPGSKYEHESNIGRIVMAPGFRSTGLGPELIKKGISLCNKKPVRIEAQAMLRSYYKQFGFVAEGDVYVVDGIDHLQMVLE